MYETVTVDEAIIRGRKMVTYPVMAIIFGMIGLGLYLNVQHLAEGWMIAVMAAAGIIAAWVYWSVMITRWKIWAFDNVRNVHELQRKAIEAQLIWNQGSFWEKTEIRSAADKDKWASLQSKIDQKDVYVEDATLPQETLIYYSKNAIMFQIGIMVVLLGFGIYLYTIDQHIMSFLLCIFGAYFIYSEYKKAVDKNPQIIINDKGIQTAKMEFREWKDISADQVITRQSGKSSNTYLEYNYPDGSVQLSIAELDINKTDLENLLHTYRARNEKRQGYQQQTVQ